jgi:drug/metabolite transporter (DMT)-like permease
MKSRLIPLLMLLATTLFWGLAYPLNKALLDLQHPLAPQTDELALTGLTLGSLFGLATLCLAAFCCLRSPIPSRREIQHGVGVGVFTVIGLWLLFLGLRHTHGSTVAFLNQFYSAEIVLVVCLRARKLPTLRTAIALIAMTAGCFVLSGFDPASFTLGKGEVFGLLCSLGFAAQVLWNGRPIYASNDSMRVTTIMTATVSVLMLGLSLPMAPSPGIVRDIFSTPATLGLGAFSSLTWIVAGYTLLIAFQRYVPAMQAAVILAFEPVFAAAFALFVPGLLSNLTGVRYPNETLTTSLVIGGSLILLANLTLQAAEEPPADKDSPLPEPSLNAQS